jgi:flagellar basal-body rod protein FlgB
MLDPTLGTLQYALDGLQLRTETIANNIANSNTPLYRSQRVAFEDSLAAAIADGQPVPQEGARVVGGMSIPDSQGNSVHLETEMADMTKTALSRQTLVSGFNYRVGLYKIATGNK